MDEGEEVTRDSKVVSRRRVGLQLESDDDVEDQARTPTHQKLGHRKARQALINR